MQPSPGKEAYRKEWSELQRASRALGQAGDLITEAHGILDRFCASSDQQNWDKAFAWKISELKQSVAACREIATHIDTCAAQASVDQT